VKPAGSLAPGGVFASGAADGRPWRLSVRSVAAAPLCLPAVLLNGRSGDVLFAPRAPAPAISNPAFVADVPGFPGTGFAFAQVQPRVTRVVADMHGISVTARPVTVTRCGQRFRLAGFAVSHASPGGLVLRAYSALGLAGSLDLQTAFPGPGSAAGTFSAGLWANLDTSPADHAASAAQTTIGSGAAGATSWHITQSLGLDGQCYTGAAAAGSAHGAAQECLPVQAPPSGVALTSVPFPASVPGPLTGYGGLVSPRTAVAVATLSDGSTRQLAPVSSGGRDYLAVAVPARLRVVRVSLFDRAGHRFATTTSLPAAK
jgi:hypothetical protein